jgi:hypothetical protein
MSRAGPENSAPDPGANPGRARANAVIRPQKESGANVPAGSRGQLRGYLP